MQASGNNKPTGLAVLAAALGSAITFLSPVVALVVLLLLRPSNEITHTFKEMGPAGYGVLLVMSLAWFTTPVLILALAWYPRLPGALFLGLGVLPWLVGMMGTLYAVGQVMEVIYMVAPTHRLVIGAEGTAEALTSSLFGGVVSAVMLLGTALALALTAAVGARHPERPRVPGAFALVCAALAVGIAALVAPLVSQRALLSLASSVTAADREMVMWSFLEELSTVRRVSGPATWVALVGGLAAAGWALSHFREALPTGRAAAVGLVALLPLMTHTQMQRRLVEGSHLMSASAWAEVQDFVPMTVTGGDESGMPPDAVVTRTHLVPREGAPVPLDGAVEAALRTLLPEADAETTPERLTPTLVLAVDARLTGPQLGRLVDAAQAAGARSVHFLGVVSSEGLRQRVSGEPLLEGYVQGATSTTGQVGLLSAVPEGDPEADSLLWHVRLESPGPFTVKPRAGASDSPRTVDPSIPLTLTEMDGIASAQAGGSPVYLAIGETVTAADVVRACEHLARAFPQQLLVLTSGAIPGSPGQALSAGLLGGVLEASGQGRGLGHQGDSEVMGSLSKEAIQQVVRQNMSRVRSCYESGLQGSPGLAGKVVLDFTIAESGRVSSVEVKEATLEDAQVQRCILQSARDWVFPSPEGGEVRVSYPFVFKPAE